MCTTLTVSTLREELDAAACTGLLLLTDNRRLDEWISYDRIESRHQEAFDEEDKQPVRNAH